VFLAGDRALKIKKPVRTAFLDYTTLDARLRACADEVRLNCRLSPDVYLGVVRVGLTDSSPGEPMVVMRRLNDADRMDERLARGEDVDLRGLARRLAAFHDQRNPIVGVDAWSRERDRWRDESDQMDELGDSLAPAPLREAVRRLGAEYFDGRGALLDDRARAGRYREGHGDLRCEHVYFADDGIKVIDCLEFDRDLRTSDTLYDIAALVADLERLGYRDAGEEFLAYYREFSGDDYPHSLLDTYVAGRHLVRAKVGALRALETGVQDPQPARLVALAIERLLDALPVVTCIGGLPGSGKSSVGSWLARSRGDVYLSSDEIRQERSAGYASPGFSGWEQGAYDPEETDAVYAEMLRRATTAIEAGYSVVLDASWRNVMHRVAAHQVADDHVAVPVDILCIVDDRVANARLQNRHDGASQADSTTRAAMRDAFHEWPGAYVVATDRAVVSVAEDLLPVIDRTVRSHLRESRLAG
jgi:aminoglycoside phosphotransferase family enzyme/predicted kinase